MAIHREFKDSLYPDWRAAGFQVEPGAAAMRAANLGFGSGGA